MRRRHFLALAGATLATGALGACAKPPAPPRTPRFAEIASGKIAYVDRGAGPAALFLHGAPLNSYQWRGAISRLAGERRCIAPDFMGLGYTEVAATQPVDCPAQVEMLAALLDRLAISSVDVIASDSGGLIAQLFMIRYPARVRTLLLTNCDTEPDSPPPKVVPIIQAARDGKLADTLARWHRDHALARAEFGAAVYEHPAQFSDEAIDAYFAPVLRSPHHRERFHAYQAAFAPNPLAGVEAALRRCQVPTRILWGTSDDLFSQASPDYLDHLLPQSRGVRRLAGARLFFPEEQPDVIADEARRLWRASAPPAATG